MVADSKLTGLLLTGVVGSRPAANAVAAGTLYAGTDTSLIYQSDGSSWSTWVSVSGSGAPTTADYLTGTAQGGLSAEIVVGTSPGGELGGTWASPTVDATHSGSAHPTGGEVFLTGDVTMTNADTFYDGPSQSLAAGTYLIWGVIVVQQSTNNTFVTAKLWDGTNVFHVPETYSGTAGGTNAIPVCAYVVLGSTATVKISAADHATAGTIKATAIFNGTTNKASKLVWIKIA